MIWRRDPGSRCEAVAVSVHDVRAAVCCGDRRDVLAAFRCCVVLGVCLGLDPASATLGRPLPLPPSVTGLKPRALVGHQLFPFSMDVSQGGRT